MLSCEFGPLTVAYDDRVLRPRPWTLEQSQWAAELAATAPAGPLLELCAGAGHIGLAAAVWSDRELIQVEADPVAAEFARSNAARAGRGERVEVRVARLEVALRAGEFFDIVLADPPYLPTGETDKWPEDPITAIDGGPDGLRLIRACLAVAAAHLTPTGSMLLQVAGPVQAQSVSDLCLTLPDSLGVRETRVIDEARAIALITRV